VGEETLVQENPVQRSGSPEHVAQPVRVMISRDRFAAQAGIALVEVGDGTARARMEISPSHLNGLDVVQGGAIFTLADVAFAAACNSHDRVAVAIDVSISFVKAVSSGTLFAEAREEALTDRLSTCIVRVSDEAGGLVALFKGTAYRKR
jgi:acyl-CoA thioesterase